jgi:hypothetical protein
MSSNVHHLTCNNTMNANGSVKLACERLCSIGALCSTSLASGRSEVRNNCQRRPHAPRSDSHSNPIFDTLLEERNSVPRFPAGTVESGRAHPSWNVLTTRSARIVMNNDADIPCPEDANGVEIRPLICARKWTEYPSHRVMTSRNALSHPAESEHGDAPTSSKLRTKRPLIFAETKSERSSVSGARSLTSFEQLQRCIYSEAPLSPFCRNASHYISGQNQSRSH